MRLAIFPVHLSNVLRLPRKSDARSYKVLHLSRKIIFPKLKIGCSKMKPISGNQRPDLLASLINMSLVWRLPRKCIFDHLCRSPSNAPCLPSFLGIPQNPHVLLILTRCTIPCASFTNQFRYIFSMCRIISFTSMRETPTCSGRKLNRGTARSWSRWFNNCVRIMKLAV